MKEGLFWSLGTVNFNVVAFWVFHGTLGSSEFSMGGTPLSIGPFYSALWIVVMELCLFIRAFEEFFWKSLT